MKTLKTKKTLKMPRFSPWFAWVGLLSIVIAGGAAAGLLVFWKGLVVTNLTDLVPWGLWITIDLTSIAVSAGAFSLCAVVYLLGLKKFQPVARTATFIGLLGYSMAILTLTARYRPPGSFLAFDGILERAFPALGSDHVRDTLSRSLAAGDSADLCQFGMVALTLAKIGRKDVTSAPFRALPGDRRPGAINAAPIFPRCSLRCVESPPALVPAGYLLVVHYLRRGRRHGPDCLCIDVIGQVDPPRQRG